MNYAEALDHNAGVRRGSKSKPSFSHIRAEKTESGGHIVEAHFESGGGAYHEPEKEGFEKPSGPKPQLPKGHVLTHIAEHLGIPHEVMGKTSGAESQEPEKEADED